MDWIFSKVAGLIFPNQQKVKEIPNLKKGETCLQDCNNCRFKTQQYISSKLTSMGHSYRYSYTCLICREVVYIRGHNHKGLYVRKWDPKRKMCV